MKPKRYNIRGRIYEIPEEKSGAFLAANPNAAEVKNYNLNGREYEIPIDKIDAFENSMGLKKKVGGEGASISSTPSVSEAQSTSNNTQGVQPSVNSGNTEIDAAINAYHPKSQLEGEAAMMQENAAKAQQMHLQEKEKGKQKLTQAAENTAKVYFENNPLQLSLSNKPNSKKFSLGNDDEDKFSLAALQKMTPFQRKVGELLNAHDQGKLTTYTDTEGKEKLAYPEGALGNFVGGFKDSWNALGEDRKLLNASKEEKLKLLNEHKADNQYLPTKPNQESISYGVGASGLPISKAALAGLVGATASAAVPEVSGFSTAGLPLLMAWGFSAPDMAEHSQAAALKQYYNRAKQENPNISDDEALKMAEHASLGAYASGLAEGTAMNMIGAGSIPKAAGQGFWNALGQFAKNQPKAVLEMGGISAGGAAVKDIGAKISGFDVKDIETLRNQFESGKSGATMQLAFSIAHGLIAVPKFVKAQANKVLENIDPSSLHELQQKAIQDGTLTEDQVNNANKNLNDFKQAGTKMISTGDTEKDAVIQGLIQKKGQLEKMKSNLDVSEHASIDNSIENLDKRIELAKNSDEPIKHAETDDLLGGKHFETKKFDQLSSKQKEGVIVPEDYGKIDTEELPTKEGEEKKYKAKATVTEKKGGFELSHEIDTGDKTYSDKTDAKNAAQKALAQHFYENKMDEHLKPENVSVTYPKETGKKTEGENVTVIKPKREEGKSGITIIKPEENISNVEEKAKTEKPIEQGLAGRTTTNEPVGSEESGVTKTIPNQDIQSQQENIGGQNASTIREDTGRVPTQGSISQESENSSGENIQRGTTETQQEPSEVEQQTGEIGGGNIGGKGKVGIHVQYPKTQLSHQGIEKIGTEHEFEPTNEYQRSSVLKWNKEADNMIADGINPKSIIEKAKTENGISPAERVVLTRYAAELQDRLRKMNIDHADYDRTLSELNDVANSAAFVNSKSGAALGAIAHIKTLPEGSFGDFMITELNANNGAPLTKKQKEVATKDFLENQKAVNKEVEVTDKYADKAAEMKADAEIKKQAKATKKTKKTHDDFVKERTTAKDKIKAAKEAHEAKLKEQGIQQMGASPFVLTKEMIAPIKDLVGSYVEEGATKLAEITKQVYDDIKDLLPEITERHIHDIIAGEYNEKKQTKSEVAITKENLRIEAAAINKLERLINGTQPKTEKEKIKRNQEIEDLKNKIKDFKKEEDESQKFYGESDTKEKRIQAKEDELQRLKDRKEKEPKESVKKEISEREQKLNEEIKAERKAFNQEKSEASKFYTEPKSAEQSALETLKKKNENETARLQGKINKGDFEPDVKKIPLLEQKELKEKFPTLYKETIAAKDARIKKQHEISLRRAKQMYENRTDAQKAWDILAKTSNVPRTLMASMDFSAPLRQGVIATIAHPKMAAQAFKFMLQAAGDEKLYNRWIEDVHKTPLWEWADKSKLGVTDPNALKLQEAEEAYLGANYAEQIPGAGKLIKGSERAYIGYLNKLRWDLFKMYAERFVDQGKTYENNPELYKSLSSYINAMTGRGNMSEAMEKFAPALNTVLFAPRLIASRLNALGLTDLPYLTQQGVRYAIKGATLGHYDPHWDLNYGFYRKLPKELRVDAAKDMLKFVATGLTTLALAKAASKALGGNIEIEYDPRSSDFGKIKVGNTRWDIWGGFQPYARLLTQIVSGQYKSTGDKKVRELDAKGAFGRTEGSQLGTFTRGKLSPILSTIWDVASRETISGDKVNRTFDVPFLNNTPNGQITLTEEIGKNLVPLIFQDVVSAMKDQGVKGLFTAGIPSVLGAGVQTYEPKPHKSKSSSHHSGKTIIYK